MTKTKTEVIFNNGENTDNGYVIKNPYATTQKFNTEDGTVEIPVYCLIQIFSMLYVGERTGKDSSFMRSDAVKHLTSISKLNTIISFGGKVLGHCMSLNTTTESSNTFKIS